MAESRSPSDVIQFAKDNGVEIIDLKFIEEFLHQDRGEPRLGAAEPLAAARPRRRAIHGLLVPGRTELERDQRQDGDGRVRHDARRGHGIAQR